MSDECQICQMYCRLTVKLVFRFSFMKQICCVMTLLVHVHLLYKSILSIIHISVREVSSTCTHALPVFFAALVREVDFCLCNMTAHVQSFSAHTLSNVNTVDASNRHEVVAPECWQSIIFSEEKDNRLSIWNYTLIKLLYFPVIYCKSYLLFYFSDYKNKKL